MPIYLVHLLGVVATKIFYKKFSRSMTFYYIFLLPRLLVYYYP